MKKESLINNIIYIFLKFLYVFVFFPKYIQILLLILLIIIIIRENQFKIVISKEVIPIFLVGLLNVVSIIFNLTGEHEVNRIFAAFNTSLLWIFCAIIYSYVNTHSLDKTRIQKYSFVNISILVFFALLMIVLSKFGINDVVFLSRHLTRQDYLYGISSRRLKAFLLYDNLVSQMFFLSFPFAYSYVEKYNNRFFQFVFLILSFLPVIMCKSRTGLVLCILTIGLLFPKAIAANKKVEQMIYIFYGVIIMAFLSIYYRGLFNKINELFYARQGSNNARTNIYMKSIEKTFTTSPIIGCGIKDMIGDYPYGSHCTYIGLFYKTGIIGFFLGIKGILNTISPVIKLPLQYKIAAICLLFMMLTGDLDGENWLIILYGILYGSISKNKLDNIS